MAPKGRKCHYHGYMWVGTRDELGREHLRFSSHPDFLTSTMPPVLVGEALLKVSQTAAERTWTAASGAVAWLSKIRADRPPTGDYRHTASFAESELLIGNDVTWAWYYGRNFVSSSVVCCPNIPFFPDIPCPLSPSRKMP